MNDPIETYLNTLRGNLNELPTTQQEEEIQELRQHLHQLVAGGQARGLCREEAVTAALAQFGGAKATGRELRQAHQRRPEKPMNLVAAGLFTLVCHVLLLASSLNFAALVDHGNARADGALQGKSFAEAPTLWMLHIGFRVLGVWGIPVLAGWLGATLAPRRAMAGIIPVYLIAALCCRLLSPSNLFTAVLASLSFALVGAAMRRRYSTPKAPHIV